MIDPQVEAYWQSKIDQYGPNYIQVYNGLFWIDNLEVNEYPIEMIAHSLSNKCRFGGHITQFYSVAQHSVIGAQQILDRQKRKAFLLHDSTEAIIDDLVRPIKKLLPDYKKLEKSIENKIKQIYNVDWDDSEIHEVDTRMLVTEASQLLNPVYPWWSKNYDVVPFDIELKSWAPYLAKSMFLMEFESCNT